MLADCLTKSMDGEMLRQALQVGQYALFDEHAVLKERAEKRSRLKWINGQSTEENKSEQGRRVSYGENNVDVFF